MPLARRCGSGMRGWWSWETRERASWGTPTWERCGVRITTCRRMILPKKKRSEEHTSELQSRLHLVCRLLLEKKKKNQLTPPDETLASTSASAMAIDGRPRF